MRGREFWLTALFCRLLQLQALDKRKTNWIPDEKVTNCGDCALQFSFSLRKVCEAADVQNSYLRLLRSIIVEAAVKSFAGSAAKIELTYQSWGILVRWLRRVASLLVVDRVHLGPQRVCKSCFAAFESDSRTLDDALATVQLLLRDLQFFNFHEGLFSMGTWD